MEDRFFCLRCNKYHPSSDKVLISTKRGQKRLSCKHRMKVGNPDKAARDAFGKSVTEKNKALAAAIGKSFLNENLLK